MVLVVGSCGGCFVFCFQFESRHRLLTDRMTETPMVDALVGPSNKPVALSCLLPASPPSTKRVVFFFIPPRGEDNLKVHRKLFASLKCFPAVNQILHMADDAYT